MPERGYVLIFFFWALLAIITPTLVLWSASAKPSFVPKEEESRLMVARRMMSSRDRDHMKNATVDEGMEAPSPSPLPVRGFETFS